jgi:LysR family hydrogen peroxide-inducible transcriptional activator
MPDSLLARLGGVTLTQLAYAAAVDTHRHFGAAAAACHVTQPALGVGQVPLPGGVAGVLRGQLGHD